MFRIDGLSEGVYYVDIHVVSGSPPQLTRDIRIAPFDTIWALVRSI